MRWSRTPALVGCLLTLVASRAQAQTAAPPPATPGAAPPPVAAAAPAAPALAAPASAAPRGAAPQAAAPPATYSAALAQAPASADSAAAGASYGEGPVPDAHVGLFANALGILQFGLSPTIEYGSHFAVNGRVLLLNTGVLSYVEAGSDSLHFLGRRRARRPLLLRQGR